jgi:hypothetical protein
MFQVVWNENYKLSPSTAMWTSMSRVCTASMI